MQQAHICLSRKTSGTWVLEGDITACFDQISHQWLLHHVLMDRRILQQWLAAGYIWQGDLFPTSAGTPQGGVASPTLANLALDGMADAIRQAAAPHTVHFIRYADDFLVIAREEAVLAERVQPAISAFLQERGLTLSPTKTVITSIDDGLDFLGQHLRKYGTRQKKLIIKPSRKNVQRFLNKVRQYITTSYHRTREDLVEGLNRKIRGWAMYHRHICAKETFAHVDQMIRQTLWRRECRMNPNMGKRAILKKYFEQGPYASSRENDSSQPGKVRLLRAAQIPIVRHVKILAAAHPYDSEYDAYFLQREKQRQRSRGKDNRAGTQQGIV